MIVLILLFICNVKKLKLKTRISQLTFTAVVFALSPNESLLMALCRKLLDVLDGNLNGVNDELVFIRPVTWELPPTGW